MKNSKRDSDIKATFCWCLFPMFFLQRALVTIALFFRAILHHLSSGDVVLEWDDLDMILGRFMLLQSDEGIHGDKFLEVRQLVWGLNNQTIAFARACLTARMLIRTLLMPSLSASLFYKETDSLQPVSFNNVFRFERFNSLREGFIRLARYSDLKNRTRVYNLRKESRRKWTVERDLEQLKQSIINGPIEMHDVIRMVGKNPFLWHDHWPVKDYARVFECLVLVDEISKEADKVVSKIRGIGRKIRSEPGEGSSLQLAPYVTIHLRVEINWMIRCNKLEQRSASKKFMERRRKIINFEAPIVVDLAVADNLLNDSSILSGWNKGLVPYEKNLGVDGIYKKHPYLIQSAIGYEVCSKADILVSNNFSIFSSLIVLERTQKLMRRDYKLVRERERDQYPVAMLCIQYSSRGNK
ncbi:hypothetical protein PVK06_033499 [Gossypium arboreum]|uniref:O-fucosyltransferase family protein n=1 Tax=Gossypium arboreum TaxID=29729 RepID=A0ABR0NBX4_GOSAR|nr:hypothetical protein PVK06_033499 [Gossypium arboreum]